MRPTTQSESGAFVLPTLAELFRTEVEAVLWSWISC
jgi:hypothetical protein